MGSAGLSILVLLQDWFEDLVDNFSLPKSESSNNNLEESEHKPAIAVNCQLHFLTVDIFVSEVVVSSHEDHGDNVEENVEAAADDHYPAEDFQALSRLLNSRLIRQWVEIIGDSVWSFNGLNGLSDEGWWLSDLLGSMG